MEGATRDRKPVLGIGMRGDLVSKVGEGLTGKEDGDEERSGVGCRQGRGAAYKSYMKISVKPQTEPQCNATPRASA